MILDDKKIEEIIEKEIKEQVTKKINSFSIISSIFLSSKIIYYKTHLIIMF